MECELHAVVSESTHGVDMFRFNQLCTVTKAKTLFGYRIEADWKQNLHRLSEEEFQKEFNVCVNYFSLRHQY
jgi:hypothetical protein